MIPFSILPILVLLIPVFLVIITIKYSNDKNSSSEKTHGRNKMLSKSQDDRIFAGVCGGIAEYFGWNAAFVRLFFILTGPGLVSYIVLHIFMPDSSQKYRGNKILVKSQNTRIFTGVAGGIAEYFGWSATIVRLFFLFSGPGLLSYLILYLTIPDSPSNLS